MPWLRGMMAREAAHGLGARPCEVWMARNIWGERRLLGFFDRVSEHEGTALNDS